MADLQWSDIVTFDQPAATPAPTNPSTPSNGSTPSTASGPKWEDIVQFDGGTAPDLSAKSTDLNPDVPENAKVAANAAQGLSNVVGNVVGMPHGLATLAGWAGNKLTPDLSSTLGTTANTIFKYANPVTGIANMAGVAAPYLPSAEGVNEAIAKGGGIQDPVALAAAPPDVQAAMLAPKQVYRPETFAGQLGQDVLSTAPLALIGGGGIGSLIAREAANAAGNLGVDTAKVVAPDSPAAQIGTGLLAALLTDRVPPTVAAMTAPVATTVRKLAGSTPLAEQAATDRLVKAASASPGDLVTAIDQNAPQWTFPELRPDQQPLPTTATLTGDQGLRNATYTDMAQASRAGNPIYQTNIDRTNQAQRLAVGNVAPDLDPELTANRNTLAGEIGTLPSGVSAQDAGASFRTGLQNVYDQRLQARRDLGANVFDALDQNPTRVSLFPAFDYATTQAASNAGEVGQAYRRAADQFSSGTGITLDTSSFANSVLKGLGDLEQSYPAGSAAARAVQDVKGRAEQMIFNQVPDIQQARQAYAQASQPLDVFNPRTTPGPVANAIQVTRFGGYSTPNDAVVSQFLRGNGAPDAIDRLNSIFPDTTAATSSLRDYIASQVQARAVNADGSVNLDAMNATLKPYAGVLDKMPFAGLKRQFSTIDGAQSAINDLTSRQRIADTFTNGLGTMQHDAAGNPMYSAAKFNNFVRANAGDLVRTYGQAGADRINQVAKQLTDAAQTAYAKVAGQSGTPQALKTGSDSVAGVILQGGLGEAGGEIIGALAHGAAGALGFGAVGKIASLGLSGRLAKFDALAGEMFTKSLADPAFARSLLTKYNEKIPTSAGTRALNFVRNRLSGVVAPLSSVQGKSTSGDDSGSRPTR